MRISPRTSLRLLITLTAVALALMEPSQRVTAEQCGDYFCDPDALEDCYNCPEDCCPPCGDGWCAPNEDSWGCPADCVYPYDPPPPYEVCPIYWQDDCLVCFRCNSSQEEWCEEKVPYCFQGGGPPEPKQGPSGCTWIGDAWLCY